MPGCQRILQGRYVELVANSETGNLCFKKGPDLHALSQSPWKSKACPVRDYSAPAGRHFWRRHCTNKAAELIICFNKKVNAEDIPPLCINGNNIERVATLILLGVFVSSDLSCDYHVIC